MGSKADIEAGRSFVRLVLRDDFTKQLSKALKSGGKATKEFGEAVTKIGVGISAVGAGMLAPIVAARVATATAHPTARARPPSSSVARSTAPSP